MNADPVDVSGALWPVGIPLSHSWREVGCILWIVQTFHLRAVAEIGVDQGGLAGILQAHRSLDYLGIELTMHTVHPSVAHIVIEADALAEPTLRTVLHWIEQRRPVLVYCDDGDKPKEVQLYAPILRPGDVLGVHDLGSEIQESDLPTEGWMRVTGPWLQHTRQAFLIRT